MSLPPLDSRFFFHADGQVRPLEELPDAPPWRTFGEEGSKSRGEGYQVSEEERMVVNAALYLRRPILVTGRPGIGKSTLPYAVAHELDLGDVVVWPITSRSTLRQGQYEYDALGRLQAAKEKEEDGQPRTEDAGRYVRLGPLGTALLGFRRQENGPWLPRVLLIDEIDKSDVDLPNELLNVFEEGRFLIPELARMAEDTHDVFIGEGTERRTLGKGLVQTPQFPLVFLTSNNEREFPPAFLRRCLRLNVEKPLRPKLEQIITARFAAIAESLGYDPANLPGDSRIKTAVDAFLDLRDDQRKELATDQLLNVVFLVMRSIQPLDRNELREALMRPLVES